MRTKLFNGKTIKLYSRESPKWFTPYTVDMDAKYPFTVHVWFWAYMWRFLCMFLGFKKKDKGYYLEIGSTINLE